MKNITGLPIEERDRILESELTRAGVPVVRVPVVHGALGHFKLERAWTYWRVIGPLPLHVAEELYATVVGKTDIRAGGDCTCPEPKTQADYYDAEGNELRPKREEAEWDKLAPKHFPNEKRPVFVDNPAAEGVTAVVESFHVDSELGLHLLVEAIGRHGLALPSFTPGSKPGPVENCEAFFTEPAAEVPRDPVFEEPTYRVIVNGEEVGRFSKLDALTAEAAAAVSRSAPSNVTYNPPLTELFTVVVDPAMPEGAWAMRPHRPGDDVPPCQVCLKRDADLAAGLSMMMGAGPARIARVVPWEKDPSCPSGVSERAEFDVNGGVLRLYARPSTTTDPRAPFCAHVVLGKDGEHGDDWHIRENIPAASIADAKALAAKEARTALGRIVANGKAAERALAILGPK